MRKSLLFIFWILGLAILASSFTGRMFGSPERITDSGKIAYGDMVSSIVELACNDTINITLDQACEAIVTPDMLLEGDFGCIDAAAFMISIYDADPLNGPKVDGPGLYRYEIRVDGEHECGQIFEACGGYIRAEDKTAPELVCPLDTDLAKRSRPVQRLFGTLGFTFDQLDELPICLNDGMVEAGPRYYDLFRFQVNKKAVYTFEVSLEAGKALSAIYKEEFNPKQPCKRLLKRGVEVSDGTGVFTEEGVPYYRFSIELLPETGYQLFTSSREAEAKVSYRWAIYSGQEGQIIGLTSRPNDVVLPLYCENIDSVFRKPGTTAYLGLATATDNCSFPEMLRIVDKLISEEDCADRVIKRKFTFKDKSGNKGDCRQAITFRQPDFSDVILPPKQAYVNCDETTMLDENGNPLPMLTGRPFVNTAFGTFFLDEAAFCGLGAIYSDEATLEVCGNTRQVNRVWTLIDWCRGEEKWRYSQTIFFGDYVGPEFDLPFLPDQPYGDRENLLQYSTGPFSCYASLVVPLPKNIRDNCSDTWEIEISVLEYGLKEVAHFPPGTTDFTVSGLPIGRHAFVYLVRDACDNETIRKVDFLVTDEIDPVAVCNNGLNISIGGDGRATVTAEKVDEGSWDNCDSNVDLAIRRTVAEACVAAYLIEVDTFLTLDEETGLYYTPWRESLDFICCEIGTEVTIELRATDDGELSNSCWLTVLIEDKIVPWCVAPENRSIPCDSLNFINEQDTLVLQAYFGQAKAEDNCTATIRELEPELILDNCGTGELIRRFQATDLAGNQSDLCEQRITLTLRHNYEIKFPKDAPNYSCGELVIDSLELRELACDLLAVNRDTSFFEADATECYKMFIDYRVINWCEYSEGQSPVTIGRDEDGDGLPGDEAVYVLRRPPGPDSTYIDEDNKERNGFFRRVTSVGFWQYRQVVKVYDDIPPSIEQAPFQQSFCALNGCTGAIDLLFDFSDNCTERELEYSLEFDENDDGSREELDINLYILGRFPKQRISGDFPIGKHSFYLTVTDGCGNFTTERFSFEIFDCLPPAPICIERFAVELLALDIDGDGRPDMGANTVWATDFIASEATDCSEVSYSINRLGLMPHRDSTAITVTCDDPDELYVEIYAWDDANNPEFIQPDGTVGGPNYSHCVARIFIQDNRFDLCGRIPGSGSVSGLILTENAEPVEAVNVSLSGSTSSTYQTDGAGVYQFAGLREGYDYTIVPSKISEPVNGVTTLDLLLINKHILGVKALTTPYKLIAADVNRSGSITTLDLIQLRKLILGILTDFPNNTSWRFLQAAYQFLDPLNPWAGYFPELANVNNLPAEETMVHDFIALKVGDVNGNAVANQFIVPEVRNTAGRFELLVEDRDIQAGEQYRVEFQTANLAAIEAVQFTLEYDPADLRFEGIDYGVWTAINFGREFAETGMLTASWHQLDAEGKTFPADDLFTLTFTAGKKGRLKDFFKINSGYTPATAYAFSGEELEVALTILQSAQEQGTLKLHQNQPNPFNAQTLIRFQLPDPGRISLSISDLNGRLILQKEGDFGAGHQEWILDRRDLPAAGIYFYTLQFGDQSLTRKLILLGN